MSLVSFIRRGGSYLHKTYKHKVLVEGIASHIDRNEHDLVIIKRPCMCSMTCFLRHECRQNLYNTVEYFVDNYETIPSSIPCDRASRFNKNILPHYQTSIPRRNLPLRWMVEPVNGCLWNVHFHKGSVYEAVTVAYPEDFVLGRDKPFNILGTPDPDCWGVHNDK